MFDDISIVNHLIGLIVAILAAMIGAKYSHHLSKRDANVGGKRSVRATASTVKNNQSVYIDADNYRKTSFDEDSFESKEASSSRQLECQLSNPVLSGKYEKYLFLTIIPLLALAVYFEFPLLQILWTGNYEITQPTRILNFVMLMAPTAWSLIIILSMDARGWRVTTVSLALSIFWIVYGAMCLLYLDLIMGFLGVPLSIVYFFIYRGASIEERENGSAVV